MDRSPCHWFADQRRPVHTKCAGRGSNRPRFKTTNQLLMSTDIAPLAWKQRSKRAAERAERALAAGVTSAALAHDVNGCNNNMPTRTSTRMCRERTATHRHHYNSVTPRYFETMSMPCCVDGILGGRSRFEYPRVIVKRKWRAVLAGRDAIGQQFPRGRMGRKCDRRVVANTKYTFLNEAPTIHLPASVAASHRQVTLHLQTTSNPTVSLISTQHVATVNPDLALFGVRAWKRT